MTPDKGAAPRTMHTKGGRIMPHLLTTILTSVAAALLEAALIRLSVLLWRSYTSDGRPAAAAA